MLKIINEGDLWFLLGVILILFCLGKVYTDQRQKLVGGLIALLAFLAFAGNSLEDRQPRTAEELFHIAERALVTFGLTLGLSWIILAVLAAITHPFREAVKASREAARQRRFAREQARYSQPARPAEPLQASPPPSPTMAERTVQIRQDYDAECASIRVLGLDEDEQRIALDQARQRLMRRLRELLP